MKPVLTIFLAAVASLLAVYAFGPTGGAGAAAVHEPAFEQVRTSGIIRCGYNFWDPGLMKDEETGELTGFFVDVMKEIGRVTELKVEWAAQVDWGNIAQDLNTYKVDAMCAGPWEAGVRSKLMIQTSPVVYQTLDVLVRADDHRFDQDSRRIDDPAVTVGVFEHSPVITAALENFPHATIFPMPALATDADMMLNLATGKIDVGITNRGIAMAFIKKNPGKIRLLSQTPLRVNANTIAVQEGEQKLRNMLESALRELQSAGVIDRLVDKYEHDYPGTFLKPIKQYEAN